MKRPLRLLILTFYYPPDLSAGSFRAASLVSQLLLKLPAGSAVEVFTTSPNRYSTHDAIAPPVEEQGASRIERIDLPKHRSGMMDQARAFGRFAAEVRRRTRDREYDLIFATSSRLMTAFLGSHIARRLKAPLYLDIRDIFVDTIADVLRGKRGKILAPLFKYLERHTVCRADRVNLVSEGFRTYFHSRYPDKSYDFYTNGIDDEFLFEPWHQMNARRPGNVRVLYAGNIGEGQGLHRILPGLARSARQCDFVVVGDGGRHSQLLDALNAVGAENVSVHEPVPREKLVSLYRDADVLFLHLNDYQAFSKVLPSKIFEYGATGKPILAGVAGYSAQFLREKIANCAVFPPCDVEAGKAALDSLRLKWVDRGSFVESYRRTAIMSKMADSLIQVANSSTLA